MNAAEFQAWLTDPPGAGGRRPLVMGVLNVTPDSFSDGGRFLDPGRAVEQALHMTDQGADLIDVGGESTRPGSERVPADEQLRRVLPVITALTARVPAVLSIDTTRSEVARAAVGEGAAIVNDISAGRDDPAIFGVVARAPGTALVLMHMQGTPRTMQVSPTTYQDVTGEVIAFFNERIDAATRAGVDRRLILLDPGIGFGKTVEHNLELLRRTPELVALGHPVVIGTSRKGFIGIVTGQTDPAQRVFGTAATIAWSVANGAAVLRVHDVGPMKQVATMVTAIQSGVPS
ncbi:MAG: dihydropteroate synthase [Tepidisphaeraceae bacterium]